MLAPKSGATLSGMRSLFIYLFLFLKWPDATYSDPNHFFFLKMAWSHSRSFFKKIKEWPDATVGTRPSFVF